MIKQLTFGLMLIALCSSQTTYALTSLKSITGKVIDQSTSEPLIGTTVTIKGTSTGTITDVDGAFSINANVGDILVFSYTGYNSLELPLDDREYYEVSLSSGINLSTINVIGSRGKPRTDVDRPVPVDVITATELKGTGQTDLGQMVQFSAPSFNSAKYGVNGTTNYADPATLKGMSPDQSLVLINGKRRHQFSTLNLNVAPGLGTVVTDLNSIPSAAIKRIEVLRDGAAAQYGSDAIAGIINLALNDQNKGGSYQTTAGIHKEGDGITFKNSLNYGFGLGKEKSFFNFTLEHFAFSGTNRSDLFTGNVYSSVAADEKNIRLARGVYPTTPFVVGNYGSNENDTYQGFYNASFPISKSLNLYTFGGISRKEILAYGFFRDARTNNANANPGLFPDGYVPELPGVSTDNSIVVGINNGTTNGWNYDISFGTGGNKLALDANNTTNPSMGIASPVNFFVGSFSFKQQIVEANINKNLGQVGGLKGLNIAFGAQYRNDNFQIEAGSPASYQIGTLAASGKAVGSSARPGNALADENDLSRSNFGIYADVEADVSDKFLITSALRFENYSDFGGNISGKLAARYKLTNGLAVRGSYNRGFRAPSLAQIGNRSNTSTVQNNIINITKQVSSDDTRLATLGIEDPKAETSNNYNIGLTFNAANGALLFTLDAFQIDIADRIVISEAVSAANYPAVKAVFTNDVREIRFFTNHINTQTRGLDFVTSYKKSFSAHSRLTLSVGLTFSATDVVSQKETPSKLLAGAADKDKGLKLLGETATELIEVAQPRQKLLLSANYQVGKFGFTARHSYFGSVKAWSTGLSKDDANVVCDANGRCVQTFSAKGLTDLSVSYKLSEQFLVTVGSNNVFDVYPDKYNNKVDGFVGEATSYSNGQIPYSRNSNQFGFNGAYYFMTAEINF